MGQSSLILLEKSYRGVPRKRVLFSSPSPGSLSALSASPFAGSPPLRPLPGPLPPPLSGCPPSPRPACGGSCRFGFSPVSPPRPLPDALSRSLSGRLLRLSALSWLRPFLSRSHPLLVQKKNMFNRLPAGERRFGQVGESCRRPWLRTRHWEAAMLGGTGREEAVDGARPTPLTLFERWR